MAESAADRGLPGDVVRRHDEDLSALETADPTLFAAFEYWHSRCRDALLPARKDIDVLQLKPVLGHTHIVDVRAPHPADYRFRLYGSMVRLDRFRNYTNLRVGDYPSEVYRTVLMEDYAKAVATAMPLYQHVVARLQSISYSYRRLILPLAEDGKTVNMLVVCTCDVAYADRLGEGTMQPVHQQNLDTRS